MKKMTAAFLTLLLVLIAGFCGMIRTVDREKDQVQFSEEVIAGDQSAADGLNITMKTHYRNHLFWDTQYRPGNIQTSETDFRFYGKDHRLPLSHSVWDVSVNLGITDIDDEVFSSDRPCTGINLAYQELYQDTAPGEKESREIDLQDYYEYYPLEFNFDLPGIFWSWRGSRFERLDEGSDEAIVQNKFLEFFKIPVLENSLMEISMKLDPSGIATSIGHSMGSDTCYSPYTVATHTEDQCVFSLQDGTGRKVDTSLIPGGYGLYSFSYKPVQETPEYDGPTGIDADTLQLFFPLAEEVRVIYLAPDSPQEHLIMVTEENEEYDLSVIRIADRKLLQKQTVWNDPDESFHEIHSYDDFWVFENQKRVVLFKRLDDGTFAPYLDVDSQLADHGIAPSSMKEMCFDGEKLAMAGVIYEGTYLNISTCDLYVTVYDQTGMIYCGTHRCSLAPNPIEEPNLLNCHPYELVLEWE